MELPGKVRDLCQICNWARTVTTPPYLVSGLERQSCRCWHSLQSVEPVRHGQSLYKRSTEVTQNSKSCGAWHIMVLRSVPYRPIRV